MAGLLLKDGYMVLKYCRAYIFMVVVFSVSAGAGEDNNLFVLAYPVLLAGIVAVNLISYDEKSKWCIYAETFPYTRKEIVSVKYVITLGCLLLSLLLIGAAQLISMIIKQNLMPDFLLRQLVILFFVGMIPPAFLLPVIFKYGVEKGKMFFYGVVVTICALFGAVTVMAKEYNFAEVTRSIGKWVFPGMGLICCLLFAASWRTAIRAYEKRDI